MSSFSPWKLMSGVLESPWILLHNYSRNPGSSWLGSEMILPVEWGRYRYITVEFISRQTSNATLLNSTLLLYTDSESVVLNSTNTSIITGWPQTWKTWNTRGFLRTWKTQGILSEFCATSGKNCNKQSIFSSSFKCLCEVRWWPVILLELMWNDPWWRSLLHLLFVAITYGKVSLWLWKSLENSGITGNFFSYFLATLCLVYKQKDKRRWASNAVATTSRKYLKKASQTSPQTISQKYNN